MTLFQLSVGPFIPLIKSLITLAKHSVLVRTFFSVQPKSQIKLLLLVALLSWKAAVAV